jgi:hypothetical protein
VVKIRGETVIACPVGESTAEIDGTVTFEPDPVGTRLRWSWQLRPKGVLKILTPVMGWLGRRQEATTWALLKRHLEGVPPTRR